jgi:hypothetical protein
MGGALKDVIALLAQTELVHDRLVAVGCGVFQIIQKTAALGDELEKPAAGRVVLGVGLEMFSQFIDAFREQSDLNVRTAGVFFMKSKRFHFGCCYFSHF